MRDEILKSSDMVLVAMGQEYPTDPLTVLYQVGEIGDRNFDTAHA